MFFGVINARSGMDCGALVDEALREESMTHKQAWIEAGYANGVSWSRAIQGTQPLDLHKLAALNFHWQTVFIAKYAAAQVRRFIRGLAADRLRMARAELPTGTTGQKDRSA